MDSGKVGRFLRHCVHYQTCSSGNSLSVVFCHVVVIFTRAHKFVSRDGSWEGVVETEGERREEKSSHGWQHTGHITRSVHTWTASSGIS